MNHKILLSLLAIPAVASSMLATLFSATVAHASEVINPVAQNSCDSPTPSNLRSLGPEQNRRTFLIASSSGIVGDDSVADFSEAESDAAVRLFGCDCSSCMRSLKQLQSQSLTQKVVGTSQGHCWSSLQRRASPKVVEQVLKTLADRKNL
jgi:hypothetical protein